MLGSLLLLSVTIFCFVDVAAFDILRPPKALQSVKSLGNVAIVGGYNVSIEDFPHQVAFEFQTDQSSGHCGAFIISENYILTAAHCSYGSQPSQIKMYAGSTCPLRDQGGTEVHAAEVKIHPDYVVNEMNNDIGIIKTDKPIKFTKTIQPIKLPSEGRPIVDSSVVAVSGWGLIAENGPKAECLMAVKIPVVNINKCKANYNEMITENMFCAGEYEEGGKDSCSGDSGGAAVQDGMAVGIVSFGYGCAEPHYPGVYVNIASPSIRKFIKETTGL